MPSYSHLSTWEREQLAALKAARVSGNSIAKALGRSAATISRELRRNCLPGGGYSPRQDDGAYLERRRRDAVLEQDPRLRQFVVDRLAEGWSPEQIAGWLKKRSEPKLRSLVTDDNLRLHLSCHPEGRGAVALSGQAAKDTPSATSPPFPRHHQEPPFHP